MNNWQTMNISKIKKSLEEMSETEQKNVCASLLEDSRKGVQNLAKKTLRQIKKAAMERARLEGLWQYEKKIMAQGYTHIIGTDEVGRGPLAGPVVAAAVVLPDNIELVGINDSKKLSEKKREELADRIKECALAYSIQEVSAEDIDRLNILHAAEYAMSKAVAALEMGDYVLIDGDNHPRFNQPSLNIIKGDSKSISIAAASIIAKVYRDHLMEQYEEVYPGYGFAKHKGYGTAEHYEALRKYGPTPIHRRSFRLK